MQRPRTQFQPTTVFFAVVLAVLGSVLVVQERKAARLRAALDAYKRRSHDRVVGQLHRKPLLKWPNDTPLQEIVEQVKLSTAAAARGRADFPLGVPIEVDPVGLERAGQSLQSPVASPPADANLTLAEKLRAVLEPLGLACDVRDACLVITARDTVISPVDPKVSDDE